MNEILSNEEIDTLLDMFRSEGANLEAEPAGIVAPAVPTVGADDRVVSTIDLLKPNRLGREQMRGIERYFESTGKLLSATISDRLRLDTRCDCVAVEQMRYGTWLEHLPGPVAIYIVQMEPWKLPVVLTASTSLLYGAVDRILGGSGKVTKVPKDFTTAEHTVAEALIGPCLDRICEGLAEVVQLKWSIQNRFCNPSMAQILPSQDVVLSVYFQSTGDCLIGDLRLVIPFASIEPLLERFCRDSITRHEPGAMKASLQKNVNDMPIDIAVQLGQANIRLRQLLQLQPGDVVPLATRLGQPAIVPVMGKPKFTGHVGRIGNRFGVQVADVMAQ
ncbi:MAG: FliM/FliN family flagellar motor switch protein [Planctomycetes bacterium]|nr:FliM/FliN family flagellar motor switch protein [Planctomycetota bacterium]MCC7399746.1 FliM/FliN family flagellar motor switch protein [Planctomycetota bacterium]